MTSANGMSAAARATLVNRTHRVVRARALTIKDNRARMRGLLLPLLLCSALMVLLFVALWMLLDGYDLVASDLPQSAHHYLMLLWFVPVSGALVALAWVRRSRGQADGEVAE